MNAIMDVNYLANENNGIFSNVLADTMHELSEATETVHLTDGTEVETFSINIDGEKRALRVSSQIALYKAMKLTDAVKGKTDYINAYGLSQWKEEDNWKVLQSGKAGFAETMSSQFPNISLANCNIWANIGSTFLAPVVDDNGNISDIVSKYDSIPLLPITVYQPLLSVANDETLGIAAIEHAFADGSLPIKPTQSDVKKWVGTVRADSKRNKPDGDNKGTKDSKDEKDPLKAAEKAIDSATSAHVYFGTMLSVTLERLQSIGCTFTTDGAKVIKKLQELITAENVLNYPETETETEAE